MMTMQEVLDAEQHESRRHIVPVSGGKDSAALAVFMKQTYPQLPLEFVFSDTDSELPETYEFLEKLEALLGQKVNRINALDDLNVERKPGRKAFDYFLEEKYSGFLPSPRARWCTINLKIKPFESYVGEDLAYSYIGIRHDEARDGYVPKKPPVMSEKPNIIPVYPFKDHEIALTDVKEILESAGLGLPKYYEWRSRSGCYFCFYQQVGEWQGLKEKHPKLFEMAKQFEKDRDGKRFTWVDGRPLEELEKIEKRYKIADMDETEGCAICHI